MEPASSLSPRMKPSALNLPHVVADVSWLFLSQDLGDELNEFIVHPPTPVLGGSYTLMKKC